MVTGSSDFEMHALAVFDESLSKPPHERENWIIQRCGDNQKLRDRVLSLLAEDKVGSGIFRTGHVLSDTSDDMAAPIRIGAYKITGLIGRGGMGTVFRGQRDSGDFDHNVAIKLIRPSALSDALIERFQRERQMLADFSHPHIAQLYDGGTTDDGAPYIIMEYIDGAPITTFADDKDLNLDARLSLFEDACKAIRYAHQNLIIHRDITPGNVLVTQEGVVKLIDFGIAKPLDEEAIAGAVTPSLASLSFTPGFAAPERSQGAAANTLSDIYSLGKLLQSLSEAYTLLPDLTAIIEKATQKQPEDRYASVDALMDDLEMYRAGFPVQARQISGGERFRKFVARHKTMSAVTAFTALALVSAFCVTVFQYLRAESALVHAEQRFTETRELTSFLLNDLPKDLKSLPGTLEISEKVNATSARYLDILAEAAKTDESVLFDYAIGQAQLGEVLTVAGGANLGDPKKGAQHFETSLKVLRGLANLPNASAKVYFALADAQSDYGYALLYHFQNEDKSRPLLEEAAENYETGLAKDPDNIEAKINQARNLMFITYFSSDDIREVYRQYNEQRVDYEALIAANPQYTETLTQYVRFLRIMANYGFDRWDYTAFESVPNADRPLYDEAFAAVTRSFEVIEQLMIEEPTNPDHIYQYVWSMEIYALLAVLDKEWEPAFEDLIGEFAGRSRLEIAELAKIHDLFKKRREAAKRVDVGMDKSDFYLERIEPFEGGSFSHAEAAYYNLKTRAYVEAQLRLNLDKSDTYLQQALAMAEEYVEAQPDTPLAVSEVIWTLNEAAYLSMAKEMLYGETYKTEICQFLGRAERLQSDAKTKWPDTREFDYTVDWTNELLAEAKCNEPLLE